MGLISIHGLFFTPESWRRYLILPVFAVLLLLIHVFHSTAVNPSAISELQVIFTARLGANAISIVDMVRQELRYAVNLFTATLMGLTGIWVIWQIWKMRKNKSLFNRVLLGFIGLFGVAHVVIFRNAAWYHEYLLFPLLPFVALTSAAVINRGLSFIKTRRWDWAGILVLVLIVAFERLSYARALLNSEYVRDVYQEAADFANEKRWENERVPLERDVYFIFYADR